MLEYVLINIHARAKESVRECNQLRKLCTMTKSTANLGSRVEKKWANKKIPSQAEFVRLSLARSPNRTGREKEPEIRIQTHIRHIHCVINSLIHLCWVCWILWASPVFIVAVVVRMQCAKQMEMTSSLFALFNWFIRDIIMNWRCETEA